MKCKIKGSFLKCVKNETRETIQKMFEAIEGVTYFKYLY